MQKKQLGIVSSYNDMCGNASYTRALETGLAKHFDVSVVSLNVELLRKGDFKSAQKHLEKICEQLKTFDCVNIQFEAGLFGSEPKIAQKRFFQIAGACKKVVLTMHRYQAKDKYPGLVFLGKNFGNIKAFIGVCRKVYGNNRYVPLYHNVIKFCKKRNIPIVVHTPRDRALIEINLHYDRVYDHPLCFYDQNQIESLSESYSRKDFCQALALDETKTYIGIFGFIVPNKGHETIIRALQHLPQNYELIIFGAQHPHTIAQDEPINPYLRRLLKLIALLKLSSRVKFYRLANDDEFLKVLLRCDFNVLPYLEVKQGGSSIAALSLETNSNVIFSQNHAFFELEKYAPNGFKMFSIGNHLELANAILSYRKSDFSSHLMRYHEKYNINTSAELYKRLLTGD